jgi:AcrR family transcriptional regulator
MSSSEPRRPRGRPPKSEAEADMVRRQIREATKEVYAKHGFYGLTVERVLHVCGLSRPTFYRYYSNVEEVLVQLLRAYNDRLIDDVRRAISSVHDPLSKVDAGLLAWRDWGASVGPVLKSIWSELRDPRSPVSPERERVERLIADAAREAIMSLGRPAPSDFRLDTFIAGIEQIGYRYHLGPQGPTPEAWSLARQAMLRLAIGMLGSRLEWEAAPDIAAALGIELE